MTYPTVKQVLISLYCKVESAQLMLIQMRAPVPRAADLLYLVSNEAKVLFHARDIRIGQVGAVQIVGEIRDAAKGQDEEVDLADQLALTGLVLGMNVLS